MRALIVAAALFAAAPALAQSNASSAVLVDATKAPASRVIIDGAAWRCDGQNCTATGGNSQTALRACRRVVAKFGQVSAFTYKGVALNSEEIAACNA